MKMYVANATLQRQEFYYSLPEQTKRRQLTIQPLAQVRVADELDQQGVDYIVAQHEKYGFLSVDAITASKNPRGFHGLCFSIDKPVTSARIETLMRGNQQILDARGQMLRREAAIASNDAMTRSLSHNSELQDLTVDIKNVELTVQQDLKDGEDFASKDAVSEGFKVSSSAPAPKRRRN